MEYLFAISHNSMQFSIFYEEVWLHHMPKKNSIYVRCVVLLAPSQLYQGRPQLDGQNGRCSDDKNSSLSPCVFAVSGLKKVNFKFYIEDVECTCAEL